MSWTRCCMPCCRVAALLALAVVVAVQAAPRQRQHHGLGHWRQGGAQQGAARVARAARAARRQRHAQWFYCDSNEVPDEGLAACLLTEAERAEKCKTKASDTTLAFQYVCFDENRNTSVYRELEVVDCSYGQDYVQNKPPYAPLYGGPHYLCPFRVRRLRVGPGASSCSSSMYHTQMTCAGGEWDSGRAGALGRVAVTACESCACENRQVEAPITDGVHVCGPAGCTAIKPSA